MGCSCHLRPTFERLYGRLDPEFAAYLEEIDPTKPGEPGFEDHMMVEDRYIAPYMTPADRYRLLSDHARFRAGDASGFKAHAAWEKKVFPTLGRRSLSRGRPSVGGMGRNARGQFTRAHYTRAVG